MRDRFVVYHSAEWGQLVEQGWITFQVIDTNVEGVRVAHMIREGSRCSS